MIKNPSRYVFSFRVANLLKADSGKFLFRDSLRISGGMTILDCVLMKYDKVELKSRVLMQHNV
jgi:hypothetical protein